MSIAAKKIPEGNNPSTGEKIAAVLDEIGLRFADRAVAADAQDGFVAEISRNLKCTA